jgi:hypothetical protein
MRNIDVRINQRLSTALDVPVQGQSLAETDQSLVQSLVHKKMLTLAALQGQEFSGSHRGCTLLVQVCSLVLRPLEEVGERVVVGAGARVGGIQA